MKNKEMCVCACVCVAVVTAVYVPSSVGPPKTVCLVERESVLCGTTAPSASRAGRGKRAGRLLVASSQL